MANREKHLSEEQREIEEIAKLAVANMTNDKGEFLANVHESLGFQEVYDYKGVEKMRNRLHRKKEQVFNQYNAATQTFQKVYYHRDLLLEDEQKMREEFVRQSAAHDWSINAMRLTFAAFYVPSVYKLAAKVQPTFVGLYSVAYYLGYSQLVEPMATRNLQSSLNAFALPYAKKYQVLEQ